MFREIAAFEVKYHLRQPLFWLVSILFFALTFGAITTDSVVIGGAIGNVNRNAPFVIMQLLLVMTMVSVFATTAFLASAVLRDEDHRTSALFFTTPVSTVNRKNQRKNDSNPNQICGQVCHPPQTTA